MKGYRFAHKFVKNEHGAFRIGFYVGEKYYCNEFPGLSVYFIGLGLYLGIFFSEIGIGKIIPEKSN